MKLLFNIIQEKLIINKHSKVKSKLEYNFDEFKDLIKDKLNYKLDIKDFNDINDKLLKKEITFAKFIDVTDKNNYWEYYIKKIIAHRFESEFRFRYIMKEVKNSFAIITYIYDKDVPTEDRYQLIIGYILGDLDNRNNKYKVKIFKVET